MLVHDSSSLSNLPERMSEGCLLRDEKSALLGRESVFKANILVHIQELQLLNFHKLIIDGDDD